MTHRRPKRPPRARHRRPAQAKPHTHTHTHTSDIAHREYGSQPRTTLTPHSRMCLTVHRARDAISGNLGSCPPHAHLAPFPQARPRRGGSNPPVHVQPPAPPPHHPATGRRHIALRGSMRTRRSPPEPVPAAWAHACGPPAPLAAPRTGAAPTSEGAAEAAHSDSRDALIHILHVLLDDGGGRDEVPIGDIVLLVGLLALSL